MKYKHLDSIDFFFVLCVLKKLRKLTEYVWEMSGRVDIVKVHMSWHICFVLTELL